MHDNTVMKDTPQNKIIDSLKASSLLLEGLGNFGILYGNLFIYMQEPAAAGINKSPPMPDPSRLGAYLDLMKVQVPAGQRSVSLWLTSGPTDENGQSIAVDSIIMRNVIDGGEPVAARSGLLFPDTPAGHTYLIEVRYQFDPQKGTYPAFGALSKCVFELAVPDPNDPWTPTVLKTFEVDFALFPPALWVDA